MSRFRTNWFRSGSSVVPALAGASSLTSTKTSAISDSRTRSTMVLPSRIPIGRGCVSQKLNAQRASAALSLVTDPNIAMGYVFEDLVRRFNEQANEEAGDHFTPRVVIKLMVSVRSEEH